MPKTMRAITIWQPWADLIIRGLKSYETRSWATGYCGPIAIHAAKFRKLPHEVYEDIAKAIDIRPEEYEESWLGQLEKGLPANHFGAVLGWGYMNPPYRTDGRTWWTKTEKALGDFSPGRLAYPICKVKAYPTPIPAKGQQGLWKFRAP